MTLEAGQARILKRAYRILEAAKAKACDARNVRWRIEEMRIAVGYAEPGYGCTDSIIAFGNWNPLDSKNEEGERISGFDLPDSHINALPKRIGSLLEKAGADIQWSDEWSECSQCCKAIRTQADSYCWTPSYVMGEGELTCEACTLEDPEDYLESLEDNPDTAITLRVDPTAHGYHRLPESYEHGWHPGQAADPKLIAEALREQDISRFIFCIDSQGQFDMKFSVYVHEEDLTELAEDAHQEHYETCTDPDFCAHDAPSLDAVEKDASAAGLALLSIRLSETQTDVVPSPAAAMRHALQNIPADPEPNKPGIVYSRIDSDRTATTHKISPNDFIEGNIPNG
jgi:hypothetical protein